MPALVAVVMGSRSDWETMRAAVDVLDELEVPSTVRVVSAHRTPHLLPEVGRQAEADGLAAIIAGAGGAAHLPGMVAAHTIVPVLGVPVPSKALNGLDSLLSIVQMPAGVPVATMAIGTAGAKNAGLLAAAIAAVSRPELRERLRAWRQRQTDEVLAHPDPRDPVITVGILGGGQLGRMLALAGAPLGIRCVVVEPAPDPPARVVADVIAAPYDDAAALAELARRCDVVTVELEHVPVAALAWLAERVAVRPSPGAVAIVQDRQTEKEALAAAGIPTAPWASPPAAFPGGTVVKRRFGGFDGRGQVVLAPGVALDGVLDGPCISEEVVSFERELSIVAARAVDGQVACYPVVENRHGEGILRTTIAPAPGVTAAMQAEAEGIAGALLERLAYVGVLAVELFAVEGRLVANEVAPRVHNSGHWTIEGAETSQFEQHLRAICGLPLGSVAVRQPVAMVNLIGALPDVGALLAVPGAHVHLYGKAPRAARKLGHVTVAVEYLAAVEAVVQRTAPAP